MIIVAGYIEVDPIARDSYVEAFAEFTKRTRQAPGCLDMAISADSVEPSRVNTFELWESQKYLDAFRAHANPPDTGVEFHGGWMQEYVIDHVRAPFSTESPTATGTRARPA